MYIVAKKQHLIVQVHGHLEMTWLITIMITIIWLKKIYNFKANNKNVNFPTQFQLGRMSDKFLDVDSRRSSLKGNMSDSNVVVKSDILNINMYFMVKNDK